LTAVDNSVERGRIGIIGIGLSETGKIMNESEYCGYVIREDPTTDRWESFCNDKKRQIDFDRKSETEEWIDEQIPLNR
jgi:hypothetical protein